MTWCTNQEWMPEEDEMIIKSRRLEPPMKFVELATRLGRTRGSVEARFSRLQRDRPGETSGQRVVAQGRHVPQDVLDDRTRRQDIRSQTAETDLLLGDPLPGYSALDLRPLEITLRAKP